MGVLHSFSIKNISYDKMDLRLFHFHVTIYSEPYEIYVHIIYLFLSHFKQDSIPMVRTQLYRIASNV